MFCRIYIKNDCSKKIYFARIPWSLLDDLTASFDNILDYNYN